MFKCSSKAKVFMNRPSSPELGPFLKEKIDGVSLIQRRVWNDDMSGQETDTSKVRERLGIYSDFSPLSGILPDIKITDKNGPMVGTPHLKKPKSLQNRLVHAPVDPISLQYYNLLGDIAVEYDNNLRVGIEVPLDIASSNQYSITAKGITLLDVDLLVSNKHLTAGEIASTGHVQLARCVIASIANTGGRSSRLGSKVIECMAANTHAMLVTANESEIDVISGGFNRLCEMLEMPKPNLARELDALTNAYAGLDR